MDELDFPAHLFDFFLSAQPKDHGVIIGTLVLIEHFGEARNLAEFRLNLPSASSVFVTTLR